MQLEKSYFLWYIWRLEVKRQLLQLFDGKCGKRGSICRFRFIDRRSIVCVGQLMKAFTEGSTERSNFLQKLTKCFLSSNSQYSIYSLLHFLNAFSRFHPKTAFAIALEINQITQTLLWIHILQCQKLQPASFSICSIFRHHIGRKS